MSSAVSKGRETTVRHSQRSRQAVPHRRSGNSKASISVACVCPWNSCISLVTLHGL